MTPRSWDVLCQEVGTAVRSHQGRRCYILCFFVLSLGRSSLVSISEFDSVTIVCTVGRKSPRGDINCSYVTSSGGRYEMKAYAGEF